MFSHIYRDDDDDCNVDDGDDDECTLEMISVYHIFVNKILFYITSAGHLNNFGININLSINKDTFLL